MLLAAKNACVASFLFAMRRDSLSRILRATQLLAHVLAGNYDL